MAIYRSHKGKLVDVDKIRKKAEDTIAVGNMGVNARGDTIKGGKVVETAGSKSRKHHNSTKTTVEISSLKPDVVEEDLTDTKNVSKKEEKKSSKKSTKKEVELENGDIIIEEEDKKDAN